MMAKQSTPTVVELPELRDRTRVFRDRAQAGMVLAGLLDGFRSTNALILAIPAGGVPVAAPLAKLLNLPLDVAVVSKITLPWNSEAGYGAVAFDGTVSLNRSLLPRLGLSPREVDLGIARTRAKVRRRVEAFRGGRPLPCLVERPVVLVDDGLASGFTVRVAVAALEAAGAEDLAVAVPTAHREALEGLPTGIRRVYCANLRSGRSFAVASAYLHWHDVSEAEALAELARGSASDPR